MKFRGLRPPIKGTDLVNFTLTELVGVINDLVHGLKFLTFGDNFESFEVTVDIAAGTEISITNQLKFIPSKYIVVRNTAGMPIGDYEPDSWTKTRVQLKNYGASDTTITVVFMR